MPIFLVMLDDQRYASSDRPRTMSGRNQLFKRRGVSCLLYSREQISIAITCQSHAHALGHVVVGLFMPASPQRNEGQLGVINFEVDHQSSFGRCPPSCRDDNHFGTEFYLPWVSSWWGNELRQAINYCRAR